MSARKTKAQREPKTPIDENLALRIDYYRLRAGMSVQELADALGRSRWNVYHWIRGRHAPPAPMIKAIAETLGVSEGTLMGDHVKPDEREAERKALKAIVALGSTELIELIERVDPEELLSVLRKLDAKSQVSRRKKTE